MSKSAGRKKLQLDHYDSLLIGKTGSGHPTSEKYYVSKNKCLVTTPYGYSKVG